VGYQALQNTGVKGNNTALGFNALQATTGDSNTAVGSKALLTNTTGTQNTAIGYAADVSAGGLNNATAIGYAAQAGASNALVLGGITGVNGGTSVNVGIGTNAPATDAALTMKNGHLTSQQTAQPTDNGSTWAITLTDATDVAGHISFTGTAAVGTEVVKFNKAYNIAPIVVITPTNVNAATAMQASKVFVTSSTTTFTITYGVAGTATLQTFNYYVIETQ
jgi:hypothetical protein